MYVGSNLINKRLPGSLKLFIFLLQKSLVTSYERHKLISLTDLQISTLEDQITPKLVYFSILVIKAVRKLCNMMLNWFRRENWVVRSIVVPTLLCIISDKQNDHPDTK